MLPQGLGLNGVGSRTRPSAQVTAPVGWVVVVGGGGLGAGGPGFVGAGAVGAGAVGSGVVGAGVPQGFGLNGDVVSTRPSSHVTVAA